MGIIISVLAWIVVSAVVLVLVSKLDMGLKVQGFKSAIIAAVVISVLAGIVVWLLRLLGLQWTGTFLAAIVLFLVAALILFLAAKIVPGLEVEGYAGVGLATIAIGMFGVLIGMLLLLIGIAV